MLKTNTASACVHCAKCVQFAYYHYVDSMNDDINKNLYMERSEPTNPLIAVAFSNGYNSTRIAFMCVCLFQIG